MAHLILLYNLQDGVTQDDFHTWVRKTDYPTMRGLNRVKSFTTYKTVKNLLTGEAPSVQYVEHFDIPDLDGFTGEDMPGETVQGIMGAFMGFAAAPEFIVCEEVK